MSPNTAKEYGRWRNLGSVGGGGQAHLCIVEDTTGRLPGRYVLKRLKNLARFNLFEREVRIMQSGLPHKNILRVVDTDMNVERPYFVAEYCEGDSLAKHPGDFRADLAAFEVARAIVEALQNAYIARLSAQRDVKPPNILFRKEGTPVLGDCGICHTEGDQRVTLTDEAMGSKDYIAPEMESGRRERVTSAVDVYALGKVIYWMLSGGHIFARESHRAPTRTGPLHGAPALRRLDVPSVRPGQVRKARLGIP